MASCIVDANGLVKRPAFDCDVVNVALQPASFSYPSLRRTLCPTVIMVYLCYLGVMCTQKPGFESVRRIGFVKFASVIKTQRRGQLFHSPVNIAAGPGFRNSAKVSKVFFSFGHQLDAVAGAGVQATFVSTTTNRIYDITLAVFEVIAAIATAHSSDDLHFISSDPFECLFY